MNEIKNMLKYNNLWGAVVPIQLLGLYALYMIVVGSAPAYWWIATIAGFTLFGMFGVAAGYHRYFSHHGFKTTRVIKLFMLWAGAVTGQGSPIFWTTIHRGYHHRYTDTDKDPHSPNDGFWHSYILWMFRIEEGMFSTKYVVDLLKDNDCLFFHKHYIKIVWASYVVAALISINFCLFFMILPAWLTFQKFALQTSVTHYKNLGYRNVETKDDSVNVPWVWPMTLGEAWHNNHHSDPKNPNYGGRHWWELDPTYWIIKLIRTD